MRDINARPVSHIPVKTVEPMAPAPVSVLHSVLSAVSLGAWSVPAHVSRPLFTALFPRRRRSLALGRPPGFGSGYGGDSRAPSEETLFHQGVVSVLVLVGVLALLLIGSAAALVALDSDAPTHDASQAQIQGKDRRSELPTAAVQLAAAIADSTNPPVAQVHDELVMRALHDKASASDARPLIDLNPTQPPAELAVEDGPGVEHLVPGQEHMLDGPQPGADGAPTSHEQDLHALLNDEHHEEAREPPPALAPSPVPTAQSIARTARLRARALSASRRRSADSPPDFDPEPETTLEEAAALAEAEGDGDFDEPDPQHRRYGPLSTHRVRVDTPFYQSRSSTRPLGTLAAHSIVAVAAEPHELPHGAHGAEERVRVMFQPRDLRTSLDGSAQEQFQKLVAERTAAAVAAIGADPLRSQHNVRSIRHLPASPASVGAASPSGPVAASASAPLVPLSDASLIGEGYLPLSSLVALPSSSWRRFALAEQPRTLPSGEPEDWAPATDHGEVWIRQEEEHAT